MAQGDGEALCDEQRGNCVGLGRADLEDCCAAGRHQTCELGRNDAIGVEAVRASPFSYTNIPASAPLAPTILKKAAAMATSSWGIMAGAISSDGRDIMSDDVVVRGQ